MCVLRNHYHLIQSVAIRSRLLPLPLAAPGAHTMLRRLVGDQPRHRRPADDPTFLTISNLTIFGSQLNPFLQMWVVEDPGGCEYLGI